jgi:hypothetical protein
LEELTALLRQLADLGLIEIDVVEPLPTPSVTTAGQAWLYGHFDDLK